jgi:hypothetical protein
LQAVSIMGEEVFSFKLSLYPSATEGEGYSDTSKVDGKVTLRLGCIQIVYLHKFLVSLLVRTQTSVGLGPFFRPGFYFSSLVPRCSHYVYHLFFFCYLKVVSVSLILL